MAAGLALHHAVDLMRRPMLAAAMREQPIPDGILLPMRVAANDAGALDEAAAMVRLPRGEIRAASVLYLQNVVLAGTDHYRVLGCQRGAPQERLREHFGWLMKWLHPDRIQREGEAAFAQRVLAAWDALKTPERRAAYDRSLPATAVAVRTASGRRPKVFRPARRVPWVRPAWRGDDARLWPGLAAFVAVAAIGVLVWVAR
jgi:hypothetical protein